MAQNRTPQEELRHAIQEALASASGEITMAQGLEELSMALAIFCVAEEIDSEVVKKGFQMQYDQFKAVYGVGLKMEHLPTAEG